MSDKKKSVSIRTFSNGVVAKWHNRRHAVTKRENSEGYEIGFRRMLTEEEQKNAVEMVNTMTVTEVLKGKASNVCIFLSRESLEILHVTTGQMLRIEQEKEARERLAEKQKIVDADE